MTFIVSTLYSVLLGTLARNLVSVEHSGGQAVKVHYLVSPTNAFQSIAVLALFMVDWICFLIVFPPGGTFALNWPDAILLVCYMLPLACLSIASVLALESTTAYCLPLCLYHILAVVAEVIWITVRISGQQTLPGPQAAALVMIFTLYVFLRLGLSGMFFLKQRNIWPNISLEVPLFISIVAKPTLLAVISRAIDTGIIAR